MFVASRPTRTGLTTSSTRGERPGGTVDAAEEITPWPSTAESAKIASVDPPPASVCRAPRTGRSCPRSLCATRTSLILILTTVWRIVMKP